MTSAAVIGVIVPALEGVQPVKDQITRYLIGLSNDFGAILWAFDGSTGRGSDPQLYDVGTCMAQALG